MPSEFIQQQIDQLLAAASAALSQSDWVTVRDKATNILALDPDNDDARALVAAADRAQATTSTGDVAIPAALAPSTPQPTSFADGRYQVSKFLGEGGKKKVYLAHDVTLDRDVAFALIKTEAPGRS